MPLEGSYAIWNNRGGTGKTTLTYHLANKYAIKHPDKTVLLIDMCPQADLSHAFLGDDENHMDYVSQIGTLKKDPMIIGDQKIPKTVSGYLDLSTSVGLPSNVDPRTFLINVSKFNPQLSRNLYLLCGDASIELVARSLEQKRNQHSSLSQFGSQAWKYVTSSLKQFIRKIAERKGIKLVVFIDMNSSFSIITEIALAACDKLLIPITDDHLHRNGFEYMFALLYGFSQPSNVYYYYRHFSFYYRANEHDVKLPKIHLILNKVTRNTDNLAKALPTTTTTTATTTSNDHSSTTVRSNDSNSLANTNESEWEFIFDLFKKHPQAFNLKSSHQNTPPQSVQEFKDLFVIDICEQASTNQIVRQAVRSHSPLLGVKNSSNQYQQNSNTQHSCSISSNNSNFNASPNKSVNIAISGVGSGGGGSGGGGAAAVNPSLIAKHSSSPNPSTSTTSPTPKVVRPVSPVSANTAALGNRHSISSDSNLVKPAASANPASRPYPYQLQTHISKLNKNLMLGSPTHNRNDLLSAASAAVANNLPNDDDNLERSNAILFDKILDKIVDSLTLDG